MSIEYIKAIVDITIVILFTISILGIPAYEIYSRYKAKKINRSILSTCEEFNNYAKNISIKINKELEDSQHRVELISEYVEHGFSLATQIGGIVNYYKLNIHYKFYDKRDDRLFLDSSIILTVSKRGKIVSPHPYINNEDDIYDYIIGEYNKHKK